MAFTDGGMAAGFNNLRRGNNMEDFFAKEYSGYSTDFYDHESNSIEWIDLESWNRKRIFYNYLGTDFPYIIITSNVDVTRPLAFARKHGVSFNLVMVYLCVKTLDGIENFRYRFIDGKPFIIHHTRALVNHLIPGEENFVMGEGLYPCDDILEFCRVTHQRQMEATPESMQDKVRHKLDIINFTSIPWISYTGFIRTVINNGVDNAPKMSFGKYFADPVDPGKIWMPLSTQTHHGLMDGRHVGRFYTELQKACNELE